MVSIFCVCFAVRELAEAVRVSEAVFSSSPKVPVSPDSFSELLVSMFINAEDRIGSGADEQRVFRDDGGAVAVVF